MQIGVQWQYFLLVNMEVQLIILQKLQLEILQEFIM